MKKPTSQLQRLKHPLQFLLLIWVLQLLHATAFPGMERLGIFPREYWGLRGIITGPLVHGGWQHLFSNSIPFIILSFIFIGFYAQVAHRAFLMIYLLTGFGVWLFAGRAFHIGLSGVIYGMLTFIFWSGIFRRNAKSIALALAMLVLYSGYFYGLIPKEGVSWESHLIGAITGIFTAFWLRNTDQETEEAIEMAEETNGEKKQYFLPRDTFDPPANKQ